VTAIEVTFDSKDPVMTVLLRLISEMSEPERSEAEAHLHMTLARVCWRRADRYRSGVL